MFQYILENDTVCHVEVKTFLDEVFKAIGHVVASEFELFGLMHFHVHIVVEWKMTTYHIVQYDSE